jgi:hypothetical protein
MTPKLSVMGPRGSWNGVKTFVCLEAREGVSAGKKEGLAPCFS